MPGYLSISSLYSRLDLLSLPGIKVARLFRNRLFHDFTLPFGAIAGDMSHLVILHVPYIEEDHLLFALDHLLYFIDGNGFYHRLGFVQEIVCRLGGGGPGKAKKK